MTIKTNKYQIRFFRVGNGSKGGDAILITLYDDNDTPHLVLIDGGYKETGESIVKHLKMVYSTPVIDIIFNTHPDRDHISGLLPVVNDTSITINYLAFNRPWKDAGFTKDFLGTSELLRIVLWRESAILFNMLMNLKSLQRKDK